MSRHLHPPEGFLPTGAPMLAVPAVVLGDVNVSVGVVGLMIGILLLVAVLIAIIAVEVAGEHRVNVRSWYEHHS
jgi:hypothetical protein